MRARAHGIHGLVDEHEDTKVLRRSPIAACCASGGIENGTTMVALYWLAANRADLRRRWR